jgi:hypothetical protein
MSLRVVDPDGVAWDVERESFRRPIRSRDAPDPGDDILEEAGDRLRDAGLFGTDEWWGTVLVFFGGLVVALLFFVVLPLLFALLGVVLALALLVARLLSISGWRVTARSKRVRLEWRVRGTLRSARAVRDIAAALERGDEWPLVDGRPPSVLEATPV